MVRVLVAHGQWRTYGAEASHTPLPTARIVAALEAGLLDYVALGDHHSREVLLDGRVAYSGTPEVTAADEVDPGWVLVVGLEAGSAPAIEPVRIGTWRRLRLVRELAGAEDLEALERELRSVEHPAERLVTLELRGGLPLATALGATERLEEAGAALAKLELETTSLAFLPDEDGPAALGLGGAAAEAYVRLVEDGSSAARDALRLLARLVLAEGRP